MYHTEPPTDKTIREWYMNSSRVAACALRNEQAVRAHGPATFRLVSQCLNQLCHRVKIHIIKLRIIIKFGIKYLPCNRYKLEYIYFQLILDARSYFCDMFRLIIIAISIHISLSYMSSTLGLCPSFLYKHKTVRFGDMIGLKRYQMVSRQ